MVAVGRARRPIMTAIPIFGLWTRTAAARARLTAEALQPWVRRWMPEPRDDAWWIDADAGVAIFRPERVGHDSVLAIRGSLIGPLRSSDPLTSYMQELVEGDTAAIQRFRGQFSLALWDGRRRRLLLARDHLGQRAMFLRTYADRIVFCSELEPLLRAPDAANELDAESAFWSLTFGMAPPGRTLARGVDRLPAAHVLLREDDGIPLLHRYWTPLSADAPREATAAVVEEIRNKLDRAIAARVAGSEAAGVFLSGGVDSTYVSATATALGAPPRRAFTAAFDPRYDANETPYATAVAEWLGVPLEVVTLSGTEAAELLETVVLAAAEPAAAWAALTHVQILKRARALGIETMLSGLGADEIFGGYDHFRGFQARFLRYLRRYPPPPGVDPFESLLLPEMQASRRVLYPGVARFFDESALRRGLAKPYRDWQYASHLRAFYRECRRLKPEAHYMEMMVAHECQHRVPDMLFGNFETLSRSIGIDVRYPFLDPDLVRLVTGLAVESRYRTAGGEFSLRLRDLQPGFKYAMMQVASDRVPEAIVRRPRKSFTAPFGGWLSEPAFAGPVLDTLLRSRFWDLGIVRREWLKHVIDSVRMHPTPELFQLWSLVTLAGWFDRYVEK